MAEELVDVGVMCVFHDLGEIGSDNTLAAIRFEIMLQRTVKSVFTELMAEHVQNPSALAVRIAVEFAGIVEVVAHDRLVPEIAASEPLASVVPALLICLLLPQVS